MKPYFKRLKEHPGIGIAFFMTILSYLAAGTNNSVDTVEEWVILGSILPILVWGAILITNFRRKT